MSADGAEGAEGGAAGRAADGEHRAPVGRDLSWHGPASVAGSVVGSLAVFVMVGFVGVVSVAPNAAAYLAPSALGLPMLLRAGAVRRFGLGLVASGLLLPAVPGSFLLGLWILSGH